MARQPSSDQEGGHQPPYEELEILGSIEVLVQYQGQEEHLPLLVVAGTGPTLLGRDWLLKLRLDWSRLNHLDTSPVQNKLQGVLHRHSRVFQDELGRVKTMSAKIQVDTEVQPKFHRARPVPYAMREKVNRELERLQEAGIIEPVEFSDWAAPIVPVMKHDGSIRICGDYKTTVNQVAKVDTYPIPHVDALFTSLSGGKKFSKLDLAHTYLQIPLHPDSKKYVTINTQKGLYQYTRLPFGVAPAIFQRTMEDILRGVSNVSVYIDDVLVTGRSI